MNTTKLNRRERKAAQLLKHYAICEALGRALGMTQPDGKKISVALFKAERLGTSRAKGMCSDPTYGTDCSDHDEIRVEDMVRNAFGTLLRGFFINSDPRGYALKIDNENPEGAKLIQSCGLHTDMGGYGILSPEINGDL